MAEDSSKYQLIVTKHGNGDLLISRSGVAILEIDVFPDTSHKGDHLFLTPLNGSVISKSEEGLDWSHELLRDW